MLCGLCGMSTANMHTMDLEGSKIQVNIVKSKKTGRVRCAILSELACKQVCRRKST